MRGVDQDLAEVTEIVRERVAANRDRGLENAFALVGRSLGITPRRARSYWLKQVTTVTVTEWRRIMMEAAEWLARDAARFEAQNAILRARLSVGAGLPPATSGCASGWPSVERRGRGAPAEMWLAVAQRSVGE